jgi:hypothetical protein
MNSVNRFLRPIACLFLLAAAGCDFFVFTDEGLVKNKIRENAEAITAKNWREAAKLYDSRFQWQQGDTVLKGQAGVKAFWKSIESIVNCDEFHAVVHSVEKKGPGQILATVTFQAHLIESSMTMKYSNITWKATMGWVKRGNADWRIIFIKELSPRKKGKFSRVNV